MDASFAFGDFMFTIVPILMFLTFAIVFLVVIFNAAKSAKRWKYNNSQPVLTVEARVVGKRADVSSHYHNDNDNLGTHNYSSTSYYITFQVESGDRIELHVNPNEYGLLVEGDFGKLTFQGTRYLGFQRIMA